MTFGNWVLLSVAVLGVYILMLHSEKTTMKVETTFIEPIEGIECVIVTMHRSVSVDCYSTEQQIGIIYDRGHLQWKG
jgi:hypothetical protein